MKITNPPKTYAPACRVRLHSIASRYVKYRVAPDPAHAVLVSLELTPDEIRNNGQLLDFLQDAFMWLEPSQIGDLIGMKN